MFGTISVISEGDLCGMSYEVLTHRYSPHHNDRKMVSGTVNDHYALTKTMHGLCLSAWIGNKLRHKLRGLLGTGFRLSSGHQWNRGTYSTQCCSADGYLWNVRIQSVIIFIFKYVMLVCARACACASRSAPAPAPAPVYPCACECECVSARAACRTAPLLRFPFYPHYCGLTV